MHTSARLLQNITKVKHSAQPRRPSDLLIRIRDAVGFYKEHPSNTETQSNPPLFPKLNFSIHATPLENVGKPVNIKPHWAVIGTNPTPFLNVLKGDYIAVPPNARTYPYLSSDEIAEKDPRLRIPSRAIQYVGFNNGSGNSATASGGVRGAYLSARYESRREETDWTVSQYLRGDTELNPSKDAADKFKDEVLFREVVRSLRLEKLLQMPVSNLSNGQTRRSRIAKALLDKPEVLLLDEPFMGLDPPTLVTLSPILRDLAFRSSPKLVLGLRPQDPIPDWITDLVILGEQNTVIARDQKESALYKMYSWARAEMDTNVSMLERKMAKALRDSHGNRPFDTAFVLTSQGVRHFDGVQQAWEKMRMYKEENGQVKSTRLNSVGLHKLERALSVAEDERTPLQWMNITSVLTSKAHQSLVASFESLSSQSSSNHEQQAPVSEAEKTSPSSEREPLIQLNSIVVKYGDKVVLGHPPPQPGHTEQGLNLTISRGSRLLLLGPNGSGKTTLLSLLTSDHPQSYSLPIEFFGRARLPVPGIPGLSLWEIQSRIGHSSPEVHAFFPKYMTIRQVLESAWAETFSSKPRLTAERSELIDHFLRVWKPDLCQTRTEGDDNTSLGWASDKQNHPAFGRLSFGTQRLLLLLRAIIKQPDIIILDEAFSGLPTAVRDKALGWLEEGDFSLIDQTDEQSVKFPGLTEEQAIVVVSHVREEVPNCINEYIRLPSEEEAMEDGKPVLVGRSDHGEIKTAEGWNRVWGL